MGQTTFRDYGCGLSELQNSGSGLQATPKKISEKRRLLVRESGSRDGCGSQLGQSGEGAVQPESAEEEMPGARL